MQTVTLDGRGDFEEWRAAARRLLSAGVRPEDVVWQMLGSDDAGLFGVVDRSFKGEALGGRVDPGAIARTAPINVPRAFIEAAEAAVCHCDSSRFSLLYRLLWRLQDNRALLDDRADGDVALLRKLVKSVRRDSHKMKAFVRFKDVGDGTGGRRRFAAWFEPDHFIVGRTSTFFARRFADMDWLIATPKGSAAWDGERLTIDPLPAGKLHDEDEADALWRIYYANIFNPARLKVKAMQSEMPKKYWKNLPEAQLIPELIASAEARIRTMAEAQPKTAPAFHDRLQAEWEDGRARSAIVPDDPLEALSREINGCDRCPLHRTATQAVCGEGPLDAEIMMIGEQPGDREDLAGRPFVGPAGSILDGALESAGLDRGRLYLTNAVKHFKYEPRGKRRIHQRPNVGEVEHCRWWLDREFQLVKPKIVVALGATAYQALTGKTCVMEEVRGMPIPIDEARMLFVTVHPAFILRIPEVDRQLREKQRFRDDLAAVVKLQASRQA